MPPPRSPPPPPPSSPPSDLRHSLRLHRSISPPPNPFPCRNPLHDLPQPAASHHRAASAPPARHHTPFLSARKLAASLLEHQEPPISSQPCPSAPYSSATALNYFQHHALPQPGSLQQRDKVVDGNKGRTRAITVIRPVSTRNGILQQRDAEAVLFPDNRTREWHKKKHAAILSSKLPLAEPEDVKSQKYLVNVLNRIKILEEQQKTNIPIIAALRMELERARTRVQELDFGQKLACKEFNDLLDGFAEERTAIHRDEQERVKFAILSLREELEQEQKSRRRHEARNMKLSKNLSRTNKGLRKAVLELEKERKLRKLMEDVCEELAKEIAKDKSQVEDLKRRLVGVREEVVEERKMLQMAEVWREERIQMKLEDARLELEERKQAVETLRSKLEEFLKPRRG